MAQNNDKFFSEDDEQGGRSAAEQIFDKLEEQGDPDDASDSSSGNDSGQGNQPSQQGDNTADDTKYPEGDWHKDPRWIKRERQHQREIEAVRREQQEKLDQLRSELAPKDTQTGQTPDWFNEAFGENPELSKKFMGWFEAQTARIQEQVYSQLNQRQQRALDEQKAGEEYVQSQLDELSDEAGVNLEPTLPDGSENLVYNEFLKFMEDNPITTADGKNLDFKRGWKLFNDLKQSKATQRGQVRRRVAAATASGSAGGSDENATDKPLVWGKDPMGF